MQPHRLFGGGSCLFGLLSVLLTTAVLSAGSLTVRVLDQRGELMTNVNVVATIADGSAVKATLLYDGTFVVDGVGVKTVLDIVHPRFGVMTSELVLPSDATGVDVTLPRGDTKLRRIADFSPFGRTTGIGAPAFPGPGCPLECPPGAFFENELCGEDTNGGCNSVPPAFEMAACGDTWCGTTWADGGTRDTDWYLVEHAGGTLSATVASQFPTTLFIVDIGFPDCLPAIVGDIGCGDACATINTASASLPAGTYVVFVGPGDCAGGGLFDGFPCGGTSGNDYVLTIDCEPPCMGDDDCPPGLICVDGICVPPPAMNDLCENAEPLDVLPGGSVDVQGTTNDATFDDVGECGTTNTAPGVWYSVIGNGNTMTASTCNQADYDTKISIFCRECLPGDLLCVTGQDDFPGCAGFTTEVPWCAQAGAEYFILVHGFSSSTGNFTLTVSDDGAECVPDVECIPPVPEGGCCQCDMDVQFCTIETEENCLALGGLYLGDDTVCETTGDVLVFESFPNVPIPDDDVVGVSDTIDVGGVGTILSLDVDLQIEHTFVGDLCVTLTSPGGIPVTLIKRMGDDLECDADSCCGCGANNLDIILDDAAALPIEDECTDDLTGSYSPFEPLSVYDGMSGDGMWTITVNDNAGLDTGTLLGWSLHFAQPTGGPTPCEEAFPDQCVVEIEGFLDIKPGSCPNSFNRKSKGKLPVALVGTMDFDVEMVDLSSLALVRADGMGGSVAPLSGPPGPGAEIEDVATPFFGDLCDCHEFEGDGILDLSLKFKTQDVVEGLMLSDLGGGEFVEVCLTGTFLDGTPFTACDCLRLVPSNR